MATTLDKFIELFPDEAVLREALVFLWSHVPGVSGVRLLHCGLEHGKDLIFYYGGPAGEPMLCACVVKNDKISGSASASSGAMTVVNQARQALGNPYINPKGAEERIERVYIISPYPILPIAMASIKGELELRAGQIVFCCGPDLLRLFEEYAATFIVAKSGLLASYLESLRRQFDEDKAFASIAFKHGVLPNAKRALSKAYVEPDFALPLTRYTVADSILPQLWRFDKEVWAGDVKDADRDCNNTARLLETAKLYGVLEKDDASVVATCQKLISLGRRLTAAWSRAFAQYRTTQEHKGLHVIPSKAPLTIDDPRLLEDGALIVRTADQLLQDVRASLARHKKLTKHTAADPLSVLRHDEAWLIAALHNMAKRLPGVLVTERRGTLRVRSETLASVDRAILITGGAGFGKTTFCRWQTIRDGERFIRREANVMPVYVPLHQLGQGPLGSFNDTFLPDPEFQKLLDATTSDQTRLRLYLDGLDEVPDEQRQREIIDLARAALKTNRRLHLVVTAREHVGGPWLSWMPHIELSELTKPQVRDLVTQLLAPDTAKVTDFFRQLRQVPTLEALTGVPLLTMLIVAAYQHMESLPENRVELYRIFVDLLCGGWDMAKGIRRGADFGPTLKIALLMRLASTLHYNHNRDANTQQIKDVIHEIAPGLSNKWELVLGDILQDGLLVQNGSIFAFRHLSFQEYLTAVDLADPTNHKQDQTLAWYLRGEDWWREVLTFYIGLSKKPQEVMRWLDATANKVRAKGGKGVSDRLAELRAALIDAFPTFQSNLTHLVPPT